tara:strand:- start:560 stop:1312 length:753 start_codon:yes stop_codon:yes gene_type:complete
MRIVIPSYNRSDTINEKSLATLFRYGYLPGDIDLFVADENEFKVYKEVINADINIIIGVKGLVPIRNFIFNYYKEGQRLLILDDDIETLKELIPGTAHLHDLVDLKSVVERGFNELEEKNLKLFGLFTCCNPLFMSSAADISYDYKFIIGNFFGCINSHDMNELNVHDIDDYERSIRSYLIYGGSVRFNHIAAKTKFLTNEGGAQSNPDRFDEIHVSIDILKEKYPKMFYLKKKKSGYKTSIILKDQRMK